MTGQAALIADALDPAADPLPSVHPVSNPVTLYDGRTVGSASEEWREWCMVRHILSMQSDAQLSFYRLVEKKRGPEARRELEYRCQLLEPYYVAWLPDRDQRQAYLKRVRYSRGVDSAAVLEERARAVFARVRSGACTVQAD